MVYHLHSMKAEMPPNKESTPVSCAKKTNSIEPRSWLWFSIYATKLNANLAKCNLCSLPITVNIYNSSTTEIYKHLSIKNGINENK
ncbi:hypothetical protein BpHYR1_019158 [Brachionus plicatilis]|uniref:BED-type domain-containing protein n=1 Tax=Brachionus plicatilis TaxID=10195 RepID=A0A3M7PHT7_BRAPC|nr:hypothetical protein BpHYR1_019158 [Brachionus plicatilis]